jgi:hypothetical protein
MSDLSIEVSLNAEIAVEFATEFTVVNSPASVRNTDSSYQQQISAGAELVLPDIQILSADSAAEIWHPAAKNLQLPEGFNVPEASMKGLTRPNLVSSRYITTGASQYSYALCDTEDYFLYTEYSSGQIVKIDKATNQEVFRQYFGLLSNSITGLIFLNDRYYAIGAAQGRLCVFDPDLNYINGVLIPFAQWTRYLTTHPNGNIIVVVTGHSAGTYLYEYEPSDNPILVKSTILNNTPGGLNAYSLIIENDEVHVYDVSNQSYNVCIYNYTTGDFLTQHSLAFRLGGGIRVSPDRILVMGAWSTAYVNSLLLVDNDYNIRNYLGLAAGGLRIVKGVKENVFYSSHNAGGNPADFLIAKHYLSL